MTHLAHIASMVLNTPLLIMPDKLSIIASVLDGRIGIDAAGLGADPEASRFVGTSRAPGGGLRPYRVSDDGTAIITITGSLVNRGAQLNPTSGLMSYEAIGHQVRTAAADPDVKAILIDLESPGGQASGAFELADTVRRAATEKPLTAVVNGMAASAGYAIASGASRIITTPSGISGSIGVVMLHADFSKALDKAGIKPTLITAGKRKADGNQFEALSADVRGRLQAQVDQLQDLLVATVARGRGARLTAKAARATEADVYTGAEAVKVGLADAVGSFEDALDELEGRRRTAAPKPAAAKATTPAPAPALSAAPPSTTAATNAAAERDRIRTILDSPAGKARRDAAIIIATSASNMTADEAIAFLSEPGPDLSTSGRSRHQRMGLVMTDEHGKPL